MARDKLTNKQRAFVEAYLANGFNASQAALTAGYKLRQSGSLNMSNAVIGDAIKARIAEMTMSADEALLRLSDMARGDMSDFTAIHGGLPFIDLEKAAERGKLHLLKEFENSDKGVKIKLYDAQAALVHILREQHLKSGEPTERTVLEDGLTDDERARRLTQLLNAARARRDGQSSGGEEQ